MANCKTYLEAQAEAGKTIAVEGAKLLLLDDINALISSEASFGEKALAAASLNPFGKVLKIIKAESKIGKLLLKCNCFTAGTKVLTDEGEKPIEEIEVGDKVLAKDDETGEMAYKEVEWLFQRDVEETYNITVGGEVITTTDEHPFWIVGTGWVESRDLVVGDVLTTSDGNELAIEKIEIKKEHKTVYNFKVKGFHTYFVSNFGIWTHNSCTFKPSSVTGTGDHFRRTFSIEGNSVRINSGHGYNRSHRTGSVQGIGTMDEIEGAILTDVTSLLKSGTSFPTKNTLQRTVTVNGSNVGYDVMKLKDGTISISTYYPK
ncbi:polymorphic toxin-type HINT domain-containing protein [Paenibacillus dendritiformis]|uniref:polymorphic toxin-type HINT domain-containing protein n=1 Tax=Paenibacillus dendritiformis TaxID=130049 RepID=UPI00248AFCA0|nr:polymorphic toxin-type HINT domain-containing protein [Paenibacillus dendritiformis]WGU94449.1 polymorphic toxin-type HINT domain-containing protein [Paenibacillus dendritiformis]